MVAAEMADRAVRGNAPGASACVPAPAAIFDSLCRAIESPRLGVLTENLRHS